MVVECLYRDMSHRNASAAGVDRFTGAKKAEANQSSPQLDGRSIALFSLLLEIKPQSELHHARIIDGSIDNAKARETAEVLLAGWPTRQVELGVIEQVEEFSAELDRVSFADREVLEGRKIRIHETRAGERRSRNGSKFAGWCVVVSARVEPCGISVDCSRGDSTLARKRPAQWI